MMTELNIITAPQSLDFKKTLVSENWFLAGGITDCPNWQADLIEMVKSELPNYNTENIPQLNIFNPRRNFWNIADKNAEIEQIEWEFNALKMSTTITFWFPKETLCPITLFELGKWISKAKLQLEYENTAAEIIIGVHPEYKRRRDIEIQVPLEDDSIKIVYDLESLVKETLESSQRYSKILEDLNSEY